MESTGRKKHPERDPPARGQAQPGWTLDLSRGVRGSRATLVPLPCHERSPSWAATQRGPAAAVTPPSSSASATQPPTHPPCHAALADEAATAAGKPKPSKPVAVRDRDAPARPLQPGSQRPKVSPPCRRRPARGDAPLTHTPVPRPPGPAASGPPSSSAPPLSPAAPPTLENNQREKPRSSENA